MSANRTLYGQVSAVAPYGDTITQLNVKFTPTQSSTPSLMPETNSVYLTRPTEGTGELMTLVGGSVAWNQLVPFNKIHTTQTINQVTMTNNGDGSVTFSGTATTLSAVPMTGGGGLYYEQDHVYFLGEGSNTAVPYDGYTGDGYRIAKWKRASVSTTGGGNSYYAYVAQGVTASGTFNANVIDLTQMLGSEIADYVYSLEQATPGGGVTWLKSYDLIDGAYHAYSAPTLQSVEATAHVTVGFNQWDEAWETGTIDVNTGGDVSSNARIRCKNQIPIFPNTEYAFTIASETGRFDTFRVVYYDASGQYISGTAYFPQGGYATSPILFTTPANAFFMRFSTPTVYGATYKGDICINLSKTTGTPKNGDYVPYVKRTYPLANITLRGMLKTDADGNLYYDGDTYEWDGTVNMRFAEVDLGTLSWNKVNTSTGHWRFGVIIANMKGTGSNSTKFKCVCTKYIGITPNESYKGVTGITANGEDGALFVCDESYSDAAAFKTAMSGVMLVYEMVSATTESADPYTAVQTVEDGGTEEFVTTNNVPVGVVGRFANAVPMEGVDSFTVTADGGTTHTYPVTLSEEIYRGYVDMLTGEAVSDMANIAEYNGETISEPWLSSLDVYSAGATPTNGAQVVYPITPEEVTATITGDPTELGEVTSVTSTKGTVKWGNMMPLGLKAEITIDSPF